MLQRIVLAYSGGLDTSVAIPWLAGRYGAEMVAVTLDLGQGQPLEAVRDRALAAGAVRAHVLDVRDEFARDYVLRALKADAVDDDRSPLGTALGRPLIARKLVEIAAIEQADAVAHGATAADQLRLETAVRTLNPAIAVLAPACEWEMTRHQRIEYARQYGIAVPAVADSPFSVDVNMWGRSIACGLLEDPWVEAPESVYTATKGAAECPAEAAFVEMGFERGAPTTINGVAMPLVELIASLGMIAGAHGVGRIDVVGSASDGAGSRRIHEAPAAVVLHAAHRELQRVVHTPEADRLSRLVSGHYADVVNAGLWFSPLREALDAYVEKMQEAVTGAVRLKLFKGECRVVGRKPRLAGPVRARLKNDAGGDRTAGDGLIKIVGLPGGTAARKA